MITFVYILLIHWICDFILQNDEMAKGKSQSMYWLTSHIWRYSWTLFVLSLPFVLSTSIMNIVLFTIINGGSHCIIDYFTSRRTSYLWKQQRVHDFFVCIGFDQFLHVAILYITYLNLLI